jgi:ankyrin repeat protein
MSENYAMRVTEAFSSGDLEAVRVLVSEEPELLTPDRNNFSRLHQCLLRNGIEHSEEPIAYIEYLIDRGVEVDGRDVYGNTPLYYAVRSNVAVGVVQRLLELGANPNHRCEDDVTPLRLAFSNRPFKWELAESMLAAGGDADDRINGGISIREWAERFVGDDERHRLVIFDEV